MNRPAYLNPALFVGKTIAAITGHARLYRPHASHEADLTKEVAPADAQCWLIEFCDGSHVVLQAEFDDSTVEWRAK